MKYRHLFFDLDHTLWDFDANAMETLANVYKDLQLEAAGVVDFELFCKQYLHHNMKFCSILNKKNTGCILSRMVLKKHNGEN